jgi:hypothetical protein
MVVIGIAGKKGSGKDMVGDYLVREHGFLKIAFADPIKEICKIAFSLKDQQLNEDAKEIVDTRFGISPRQMMQKVGTDMFRAEFGQNFWVNRLIETIASSEPCDIVVTDVRFDNEMEAIRDMGGQVILLSRHVGDGRHRLPDHHVSETGIEQMSGFDAHMENNGDPGILFEKVENFISPDKNLSARGVEFW